MESYFWLKAHQYVYCLQRLTRPPQVWKKVEKKSCISWTNILSNPMKLWGLAFLVVHHYHHQPHHHDHHHRRQLSPPLASSPGGAQSDKVLSSASMSTRVAPRDHVNSPALFIIRKRKWKSETTNVHEANMRAKLLRVQQAGRPQSCQLAWQLRKSEMECEHCGGSDKITICSERFYKNQKVRSIGNNNRTTRILSGSFFLSPISLKMLEISLQSNRSWNRKIYQKTSSPSIITKDDPINVFGLDSSFDLRLFLCKFGNHPGDDNIDWLCLNNFRRRHGMSWRKRGMMILRITMTKLPDKRKFSSIRSVYPVQLCTVPLFVFLYLISSYIALRAGLSTQSSCATRVFKDGGDDQRESQVELLLQRQIHRHTKTNAHRHWWW